MSLDRRLHAYRDDLAEERLQGRVDAVRFVAGRPARVAVPLLDMLRAPEAGSGLDTQLLLGEAVTVFDEADGIAWVQAASDGYVGYVRADGIGEPGALTNVVVVPRTFVYREPDMKKGAAMRLSMGCAVTVADFAETRGTLYARDPALGWIVADHLAPADARERDYVAVAARLLDTPYLWGGRSAEGIDCSGLVQLAMRMAGRHVLRDSDQQQATVGTELGGIYDLSRGDLVFWRGHVGMMEDAQTLLHATGSTMLVTREKLSDALARIAPLYGPPVAARRP